MQEQDQHMHSLKIGDLLFSCKELILAYHGNVNSWMTKSINHLHGKVIEAGTPLLVLEILPNNSFTFSADTWVQVQTHEGVRGWERGSILFTTCRKL